MLTLGVFAFLTQGDFDQPGPPSAAHRLVSAVATVLEFPFVWAVRRYSPERHGRIHRGGDRHQPALGARG